MPGSTRPPLHLAAALHAAGWRGPRPDAGASRGSGEAGHGAARPSVTASAGSVAATVGRLARAGRQQDGTTCGAAVLTMLAAAGDPALEGWLVSGRLTGPALPPELTFATPEALGRLADAPVEARVGAVHRVVQRRTSRAGVPWPRALGTSPWGAAAVARFPGVRWRHHPLGGPASVAAHLRRTAAWVDRGVPVPLYSGGDLWTGVASAAPRHVVLVVGHRRGLLDVWEPSQGQVVSTSLERVASGNGPLPALGGWSRAVWALVPWRSGPARARMEADPGPE